MRGRTIELEVTDKRGKAAKTIPLYQYDYGQKLLIKGVELPEYYEVHFSNQQYGDAITVLGDSTGVLIPDSLVATGETIYVWLFLHDTSFDGETEYMGVVPVIKRAQPTDVTPTPEEQSIITEVIAALNNMEDDMSEQVQAAEAAKEAAQTAQTAAEGAATTASGYVDTVTAAQAAAEAAQAAAETAATSATASATSATSSANSANNALAEATNAKIAAVDAADSASTSATTATTASGNASNYATSAESAKVDAVAAATAAETAQTAAETAQGKAEDAQTAAETAQTAAETAQGKAEDAQAAAESAQTGAEGSAEDSEAYAVGTRGGVDVESDDPAYENNAKYYAEEAAAVLEDKLDAPATAGTAGQVLTSDGEGGQAWADPSGAIDDTAGEGDTDVTWSADKLDEEFTDVKNHIHGVDEVKADVIYGSENGSIVKIKDGSDGLSIRSIQINITPVQSGEGEPSSQNIRPFIGFTGCKITKTGENILDISQYDSKYNEMTIDKENDSIINSKIYSGNSNKIIFSQTFPKGTYTIYGKVKGTGSNGLRLLSTAQFQGGTWNNSYQAYWKNFENNKLTFTVDTSTKIGLIFLSASGHTNEPATGYGIIFTKGNGEEYNLSWNSQAGTLYGAEVEAISGGVVKTFGRIDSYNGEELPGIWYSDRDVYEEGTYPTTGAEVVYELPESISYTITGINVNTTYGENNLWSSTDSGIDCEYRSDTELFLKKYAEKEISKVRERIICVNPKMFGAVGDGVTDDSAAMQETFDYASGENIPVDVTNGSYLFENVLLRNNRSYEVYGTFAPSKWVSNNTKLVPSLIVKAGSVGFIGERSSDEQTVSSLPNVYMNMHNVVVKGQDGQTLPVIFKDVIFTGSNFYGICATWFSCFIEGILKGNSFIRYCNFMEFTETVFRSWTDKNRLYNDVSFPDTKFISNQFLGNLKHKNTLNYPSVFEGNTFLFSCFSDNFIGSMWSVVKSYDNYVTGWRSNNNIYSFCPYLIWKINGDELSSIRFVESNVINDAIWNQALYVIQNSTEGQNYFNDYSGNPRITQENIPFINSDSIEFTVIKDPMLNKCDNLLRDVTKFISTKITKAYLNKVSGVDYAPSISKQVENIENAFTTKIPITDYNDNHDNYIYTHIDSWDWREETTIPIIEDSNYRYVLEGQKCYYNNKLLICHGDSWYDAMGNVIS